MVTPFEERRSSNQDRRSTDRRGKYDRRKNRCGACCYFEPGTKNETGYCAKHEDNIEASAFACPFFQEVREVYVG